MEIRTDDPFRYQHPQYVVAAYLAQPLFDEFFPLAFAKRFDLSRKSVMRALVTQSVGHIVTFGTKNNGPVLACVIIGTKPGDAKTVDVARSFRKLHKLTDGDTAVISDNFRFEAAARTAALTDFDILTALLRRVDYSGVLYGPMDMTQYSIIMSGSAGTDERATFTHGIIRSDGNISPSIMPTMLRGIKPKKP